MTDRSPKTAVRSPDPDPGARVARRIRAWRGQRAPRALAALLLVPVFSNCGGGPPPPAPVTPPEPDSIRELTVAVDPTEALRAAEINRARTKLAEANALLNASEYEQAASQFEQVSVMHLSGDPTAVHELQVQALLGIAISNMLITPNRLANATASRTALQTVIATYDGTIEAATARLVLGMVDEMDRLRVQGARNQEDIRRLEDMVEQLRRIDLTRRPGGAGQ
jgi:outer membrane PBP1 activator LpoA protein